MAGHQLTPFEHVLLGMICLSPSSGYDLKRIFAATPMGVYQPSSGALYPAFRRVYEVTQAGRTTHVTWLRRPVEPATVAQDLGLHLMRFVMMEHMVPRKEVLGFLHDLKDALAAFVAQLERYPTIAQGNEIHPGFAVDHGLAVYRASLDWAERTIAALT